MRRWRRWNVVLKLARAYIPLLVHHESQASSTEGHDESPSTTSRRYPEQPSPRPRPLARSSTGHRSIVSAEHRPSQLPIALSPAIRVTRRAPRASIAPAVPLAPHLTSTPLPAHPPPPLAAVASSVFSERCAAVWPPARCHWGPPCSRSRPSTTTRRPTTTT
jgi:hypothetical protein